VPFKRHNGLFFSPGEPHIYPANVICVTDVFLEIFYINQFFLSGDEKAGMHIEKPAIIW